MRFSRLALLISVFLGTAQFALAEPSNPNRPIKDKWAVVIGISKFSSPEIPPLKYPAKDARDFHNFLLTKGSFAPDHVLLLTDEKATKVNILDAFGDGWLPRRVLEDDLVVVFISSHGSPADVAGENFVIAYDTDPARPYATGIRLQDLANELTKRTGCDRIVLLLDACHSGAAITGQKGLIRTQSNFKLDSITGEGQLVISSSRPDEVSWESKRYPNGVFTKHLIAALQKDGQRTRLNEAYQQLRDEVQQEVRFDRLANQVPMILSKWKGADVALCAPPAQPRKVLGAMPVSPVVVPATPATAEPSGVRPTPAPVTTGPFARINLNGGGLKRIVMMTTDWLNNQGDVTLESGTRLISPGEIADLSSRELLFLYNEAYARHGRGFMMKDIQQYFNSQPWYKIDPDYHYRPDDPKCIAKKGQTDDPLVINERRTPKQWANMQTIKRVMNAKK